MYCINNAGEIAKHNMPSLPLPLFPPHINQFSEKYTLRNTLKKYIHEKIRIIHIDKCSITTWPPPPSSSHQSGLTIFKTVSCKCFLLFWIPATKNNTRESKCFSFWIKNHFLWKYSSPFILYGCSLPRDLLMLLPRFFPRVKIYAQTLLQNIKFEFRPQRHKLLNLLW